MEEEEKDKRAFVLSAYWDDFLYVAKVNVKTGEFEFLKTIEEEKELEYLEVATMQEYLQGIVDRQLVYPDDLELYRHYTDLNLLWQKSGKPRHRISYSFRRKILGNYRWVTFEITFPKTYSKENPWVIFSVREADSDSCALEDALKMLSEIFYKILKINLTTDTHEDIKTNDAEILEYSVFSPKVSEWFENVARSGKIHPGDVENYLAFTDIEEWKAHFRKSRSCLRLRYRRKIGDDFRWVSMEVLPSIEYTDENQIVLLYVRDIHDSYVEELRYQKELEYYCNYDVLTGLHNRYYYSHFCAAYDSRKKKGPAAVLFADLNDLKYVNDTFGHKKGDEYIRYFSRILAETFGLQNCCRISGDEFVVILEEGQEQAMQKFEDFYQRLWQREAPIASVGYFWAAEPAGLDELVRKAETAMYQDKERYYKKYPKHMRT